MNIQEKLTLTKCSTGLCIIKDNGLFCSLYNQSAYIITQLLHYPLKLHIKTIKKLNNEVIISCGLPVKSVLTYFPKAHQTNWGYELEGDYDLSDYWIWRTDIMKNATHQLCSIAPEYEHKIDFNRIEKIVTELNIANHIKLTPKQIAFLLVRDKTQNHINNDSKFLTELTSHIRNNIKNNYSNF